MVVFPQVTVQLRATPALGAAAPEIVPVRGVFPPLEAFAAMRKILHRSAADRDGRGLALLLRVEGVALDCVPCFVERSAVLMLRVFEREVRVMRGGVLEVRYYLRQGDALAGAERLERGGVPWHAAPVAPGAAGEVSVLRQLEDVRPVLLARGALRVVVLVGAVRLPGVLLAVPAGLVLRTHVEIRGTGV